MILFLLKRRGPSEALRAAWHVLERDDSLAWLLEKPCRPLSPAGQGSCPWPQDVSRELDQWAAPSLRGGLESSHKLEKHYRSYFPLSLSPLTLLHELWIDLKTNLLLRASRDACHLSFLLHLMSFQGTVASSRRQPSKDCVFASIRSV